ncbi:MAG: ABC transporter permease [Acidobacteriaceae bacterium]|nr:ABC transporter permease [Acidobacteriaceae bacterium]
MDWSQSQTKLFRALLYCYPAEFRHEYGIEMEHVFASRLAHEPHWRLWLETCADLAVSALHEHFSILASDLKHELRALRAIPGFTLIVLLVTGVGIGAAVSVFSVVNAVLLRSLPYAHPENLVYLYTPNSHYTGLPSEMPPNVPDVYDWERLSHTISSFAMFITGNSRLIQGDNVTPVATASVSADFFKTLDVKPMLGRTFEANDDQPGHELVAIISHELWVSHFKGRPNILGGRIQLNRKTYTVIGITAPDFGFPFDGDVPYLAISSRQTDLWIPLAYTIQQKTNRQGHPEGAEVFARLNPAATPSSAQSELNTIESHLNRLYAPELQGWRVLARPLVQTILGPVKQMLWTLLGVVGLVLLIAISNIAGLLLARISSRSHELSIRAALGAERARIVRQLLTESLLLSCTGGAFGIALAYALVRLFIKLNPGGIPRFEQASVDTRILSIALALSIGTGVAAGLLPALSGPSLRAGAGNRVTATHRGRFALIVFEIAVSVVLLSGAGLLIRSYLNLQAVNPGFSRSVLTFQISLDEHYPTAQAHDIFYRSLLAKLQATSVFTLAGASTEIPLTNVLGFAECEVEGYGRTPELVQVIGATPKYREAIGTPLLRGRDFTPTDVKTENVLINKKFSDSYFRGRDPIGGRIRLTGAPPRWGTVIGVLADVRDQDIAAEAKPTLVQPAEDGDSFAVRTNLPPAEAASQIRSLVRSLDPALSTDIKTMGERIADTNARRTFQTSIMSGFASIAVVLTLAGLFGLMSFTVNQRTNEIGIRLAIGAPRSSILTLIVSQGIRLTTYGLLIGFAAALALTRLVSSWLFNVKAIDPLTSALVVLATLGIACAACSVPAWRATRIDPVQTLRRE